MMVNVQFGYMKEGASTLTQQIARKVFLHDEKTVTRKLREMAVALGIESVYSKESILEMYLNTVAYGPRTYGVSLAAQKYFQKNSKHLSEAESLALVVMPQNPVVMARQKSVADWLLECTDKTDCAFAPDITKSRLKKLLGTMAKREGWNEDRVERIWDDLMTLTLASQRRWVQDEFLHWQFFVRDYLAAADFDFKERR